MLFATETMKFTVEGMHCAHCQSAVEKALNGVKGVKKAVVSLEEKTATVTVKKGKVNRDALLIAMKDAGFEVLE